MKIRESGIRLREADEGDVELLRYWDTQPHVKASDPNDDWHWEDELPRKLSWREMLIAEADAKPIGFVQIIDPAEEESHYWGEVAPNLRAIDIWIGESDYLGKGYGTRIMAEVIERCLRILPSPPFWSIPWHQISGRIVSMNGSDSNSPERALLAPTTAMYTAWNGGRGIEKKVVNCKIRH